MAKEIEFEGTIHEFPDDFTDAEIARALKSYKPVQGPSRAQLGLPQDSTGAPMPTREQLGFLPPSPPQVIDEKLGPLDAAWNAITRGVINTKSMLDVGAGAYAQTLLKSGGFSAIADPGAGLVPTAFLDPSTGDRLATEVFADDSPVTKRFKSDRATTANIPKRAPASILEWKSAQDVAYGVMETLTENLPYMGLSAVTLGAASHQLATGELQSGLMEKGVRDRGDLAGAMAIPFAAADTLSLGNTLLSRAGMKYARGRIFSSILQGGLGALGEGFTEGPVQGGIELATKSLAGVPETAANAGKIILENTLGGMISGGVLGGASHFVFYDPQVAEISGDIPPAEPTATQEEMFPLEDPQPQPEGEAAPASQPGQQTQTVDNPAQPLNTPLELNIKPVAEDKETFGDFTANFTPRTDKPAGVQIWDGKASSNGAIIAEAQDGRYQVTAQLPSDRQGRRQSASWVFPSFEQAAWVGAHVNTMSVREQREIANLPSEDAFEYVYQHGRPDGATIRSVNGEPLHISNITHSDGDRRPLTFAQLDKVRSSPRMVQMLTMLDDVVTHFRKIWQAKGITVSSTTNFLFDPKAAYGYNRTHYKKIAINVGAKVLQDYPPQGFATSLMDTIIHEFAHDLSLRHDREFQEAHGRLTGALLTRFEEAMTSAVGYIKESYAIPYLESINALTQLVADPTNPGAVDPRIREVLLATGGRQTETLSREDSVGRSFEELISGEPQGEANANGGGRDAVQLRPVVDAFGQGLAQPIWFSRLGNALFGPTGIYGNAKQLSKQQLLAIANHPERYGIRKDEIEQSGFLGWLKTSPPIITVDELFRWFEATQIPYNQIVRRDLPVEGRIFGQQLERAIDESGAVEDEIDDANREQTHADLDHFWVGSKLFSTVLQNAWMNRHIPQLQNFVNHLRELVGEKNKWKYEGERVLKDWNRLGKAQMSALSNFLFDIAAESDKFKRRLTLEELDSFAKKHNLGDDAKRVYHGIDSTFRSVLEALRDEELRRIKQRLGESNVDAWAIEQGKLNREFAKILDRNYFPYARFGNHVVLAVATKDVEIRGKKYRAGNTVHMSTYSSRREMRAMEKQLKREMAAYADVQVGNRYLPDQLMEFQGFPAHLYKQVVETLKLTDEQADLAKRFFLNLTPSQSFIQHMRKRRGIAGFSLDAQRVFSHYLSSAAGHVARAKHGEKLKQDLTELKGSAKRAFMETGQGELRDKLAEYAERAYDAAMKPGNDFGMLRGLIFAHYFAFVPTQALVNLMQLPMMTFPHLAIKYGPAKAAAAMVKAMKAVTSGFNFNGTIKWSQWDLNGNPNIPAEAKLGLERGIKDGFINESFAVEVASLANGNILEAMLPFELRNAAGIDNIREGGRIVRDMIELGTSPFRLSEEWNRRVAFIAAHELEYEASRDAELSFREARETVEQTMYEYAGWNRPEIARNKASILFLFKTYMQHSLWYYMNGRGRVPALVMLGMMAGLEGLPGAEDLMEIFTWLMSDRSLLGTQGKRVDPRKIIRSYMQTIMDDPDVVMHGAARRSFGLGYISGMPGWDLSPKLGMGRIVPGLVPAAQGARGEMTGKDAVARMAEEWIGVAGTMGMNAARAAVDNGPQGMQWKMAFYPAAVRNIVRTIQSTNQGALVDGRGEPLVRVDQTDPTQLVEVLGQSLGLRPTRLATNQEANYRASQENAFFIARQQHLMSQLESALLSSNRDQEAVAEARRAIKTYNETMPPQFRMSASQIIESLKRRSKGNALRERGLPTQKAFRQIQQEWKSVYPTQ